LPELAAQRLPAKEIKNQLKKFKKPIPTREVSLVTIPSPIKQTIAKCLESEILLSLPKDLKNRKKTGQVVIDI